MRNKVQSKLILAVSAVILVVVFLSLSLSLSLGVGPSLDNTSNNDKLLSNRFALDLSKQTKEDKDNQEEQIIALDVDTIPTNAGYIFLGYAWDSTATTPDYAYDSNTNTFTPNTITLNSDNPSRTLFAVWKDLNNVTNIADATYLQQMNEAVCNSMTLDQTYTLKDKRDNKEYTIARLKMKPDGSKTACWITQNLALKLSTTKTLTSNDTDLNDASGGVTLSNGVYSWTPERSTLAANTSSFPQDYNNPYSWESKAGYGVYYNWTAAIASNDSSSLTKYVDAPNSVCPKGWKLATGSATDADEAYAYGYLFYSYGFVSSPYDNVSFKNSGYTKIHQDPFNFVPSGNVDNSGFHEGSGSIHYFWSPTVYSTSRAYIMRFDSSKFYIDGTYQFRPFGMAVRCMVGYYNPQGY